MENGGGGGGGLVTGRSPEDPPPGPGPPLPNRPAEETVDPPPVLPKEIPQFVTMNEEPATICFNEDDYYCPVCQDVFKTPVRISICQHVFCRKCFLMAMKEGGTHCPLCRGIVTRKEKARPSRALDVENNMKKLVGSCRCCDKQIRLARMRQHYKSCKKYQDEYGVSSVISNLEISQDSSGNSFRSDSSVSEVGENSILHVPEEAISRMDHCSPGTPVLNQPLQSSQPHVHCIQPSHPWRSPLPFALHLPQHQVLLNGQSTYKCPLCQESNFTRQNLLDHCNDRHLYQIDPVICPICVSLPWGDPNWVTRNLVGHLNQRHQLDYGDFLNLQLDEETLFQNSVEESCQVNL